MVELSLEFASRGPQLEAVFPPIRLTTLQPVMTGPLLLLLLKYPLQAKPMLPPRFQEPANYLLLPTALKSLLGIGIVRKAQNWLSHEVLNNFASDNTWDWPQEIVVMTEDAAALAITPSASLQSAVSKSSWSTSSLPRNPFQPTPSSTLST
jgi:hypothetical protein